MDGLQLSPAHPKYVKPAQTREAARNVREAMGVSWWLYVVEALGDERYRVHPIKNPLRCGGLALRGDVWRQHSVDSAEI